jgi:hypothetical protein
MAYEIFQHLNYEKEPETPNEFDSLFCKIAEKTKPDTFKQMEETIKEAFDGKYDNNFIEWGEKLKLDREKLMKLFIR